MPVSASLDASLASAVVLAEHVQLRVGAQPDEVLQALAAQSDRPGLDDELADVDGLPVYAARQPDVDVDGFLADTPDQAWPTEAARALTLLAPVLHQAFDSLMSEAGPDAPGWQVWQARSQARQAVTLTTVPDDTDQPHHLAGVARPVSPAAQLARQAQAPLLTVVLVLPPWTPEVREQALAWVKARSGVLLDWSEAMQARGVQWVAQPLGQNEDLWRDIDQTLVRWQREGRPELMLVLAADSALSPDIVARMQAKGELFTAQHQSGRMPGEGAAALLLGTPHWLGLAGNEALLSRPQADHADDQMDASAPLVQRAVRLGRPLRVRRDKSADAHGRNSHAVVAAGLGQLHSRLQLQPAALQIVADADHRASRCAELYESLADVLPDADPMLAIARVGVACGDLGVAGTLVPTALAAAWARQTEPVAEGDPTAEPVSVAVHVQASHERVLVPLQPWRRPWPIASTGASAEADPSAQAQAA